MTRLSFLGILLVAGSLAGALWLRKPAEPPAERFVDADPKVRLAQGDQNDWLGVQLSGAEELADRDPDDPEAIRQAMRAVLLISAIVVQEQQLPELVARRLQAYSENRKRVDPDGSFLKSTIEEYIAIRRRHEYWHARAAFAIYMSARGEERGLSELREFWGKGGSEFAARLCAFCRNYFPPFDAVKPLLEEFLQDGELHARVNAGLCLLEYVAVTGEGTDLLEKYRREIQGAFHDGARNFHASGRDPRKHNIEATSLLGLGALAGERDLKRLRYLSGRRTPPRHAILSKVARVWAGILPVDRYTLDDDELQEWTGDKRILLFHAVAHRLARTEDAEERAKAIEFLESGFKYPLFEGRIVCMRALQRHGGERHADILEAAVRERTGVSIVAASMRTEPRDLPVLLAALAQREPELNAMAALRLLEILKTE